jgi:hypothetical protein
LKDSFQELFCLASNRDATVADLRSVSNDTAHWDIKFPWYMIGRWTPSLLSSMFCTQLEWVGRVLIVYVRCPKEELLRSKLFIRFSFLIMFPLPLKERLED